MKFPNLSFTRSRLPLSSLAGSSFSNAWLERDTEAAQSGQLTEKTHFYDLLFG
jgi:hypothetical protein